MADNVSVKDFSGASVTVLADEVTGSAFGAGQVQVMKVMDGTANSTNMQIINAAGETSVVMNSVVSPGNTSLVNLAANGVFTGVSEDITNCSEIRIAVYSSHASATDGLSVQQSIDGTTWSMLDTWTIAAGAGKQYGVGSAARFFRVVYTNGATATTTFQLFVTYHKVATKPTSQRPSDSYSNEFDAEQVLGYNNQWDGVNWQREKTPLVRTSDPNPATANTPTFGMVDQLGKAVVMPYSIRGLRGTQSTTIANTTVATTVVTAGNVLTYNDITNLTLTNASATIACTATLNGGTGGTSVYSLPPLGGVQIALPVPRNGGINTAWTITLSVATVTVYCVVDYIKVTA